ncbi:MAG: cation transporter [Lachnospiraceae bacterium]|jgi:copper chaperone CopZ
MRKKYSIDVDCANCAAKVETALNEMPGLKAQINFMTQKMILEADTIDDALLDTVEKTAKRIEPEFAIKR